MNTIESIKLIYRNPTVHGGQPCVVGTEVRVAEIVMATIFEHQTPQATAVEYAVSLAGVHAAFAYYYTHKDEIDAEIRKQLKAARELQANSN